MLYLLDYVTSKDMFVCPNQIYIAKEIFPDWSVSQIQTLSYAMTHNYAGTWALTTTSYDNAWTRLDKRYKTGTYAHKDPSRRILLTDSVYYYSTPKKWAPSSFLGLDTYKGAPTKDSNRTIYMQHANQANAAYFDGHAAPSDASDFRASGIHGGRNKALSPVAF